MKRVLARPCVALFVLLTLLRSSLAADEPGTPKAGATVNAVIAPLGDANPGDPAVWACSDPEANDFHWVYSYMRTVGMDARAFTHVARAITEAVVPVILAGGNLEASPLVARLRQEGA